MMVLSTLHQVALERAGVPTLKLSLKAVILDKC